MKLRKRNAVSLLHSCFRLQNAARFAALPALIIALLLGLAGCGEEQGETSTDSAEAFTFTDNRGETVVLDGPPERIAAMTSFAVEMLMAMDKTPVARFPDDALYPPQAQAIPEVNKLGGNSEHRLDVEQLIARSPDLVILHTVYAGVADNIEQSVGAPVLVLNIKSIDELREKFALFGKLTQNPDAAEQMTADLDQTLAWLEEHAPADKPRVLSLLGMGEGQWFAHRGNHFMGSLLGAVGAENIAAGDEAHGRYRSLSPIDLEQLIIKDPDVIFLIPYGDADTEQVVEGFSTHPATRSLRAVREGRIHVLPDTIYTSQPGPRTGEALTNLYRYLHPDAEVPEG